MVRHYDFIAIFSLVCERVNICFYNWQAGGNHTQAEDRIDFSGDMQGDSDDFIGIGIGDLTDDPDMGEMGDIFGMIGGGGLGQYHLLKVIIYIYSIFFIWSCLFSGW